MIKFTHLLAKALLFTVFIVGCKDDPQIICYLATLSSVDGGTTSITTFTYNSANKVLSITSTGGGFSSTQTFTYDANNNATSAVYISGSSASTTTFTYDASNRLTGSVNTSGSSVSTTTYTYNASGQNTGSTSTYPGFLTSTITRTYPNTTTRNYSSATYTTTFVGSTPSTGNTAYLYDDKINPRRFLDEPSLATDNNVTKETYTSGGTVETKTTTYAYNEHGYPTTETSIYSGGSATTQTAVYTCK